MPLVRIGRYDIIHPLGESKDALYLARDYELDLQVILQLLPIDDYGDEQRERLRRRMREAARLQHPHIARILDFGTEGAFAYVAMEYAAGEPLPDAVRRLGRLPEALTLGVMQSVCSALDAAHEDGVIHRHLRLSSLRLLSNGTVQVLGFGLEPNRLPTDVESARYLSPEVITGTPVQPCSDVFSVGAILYELTEGRPAFVGDTVSAVVQQVLHDDPPPMRLLAPGIDPALRRVVSRALAKNPSERYATARAMRADLGEIGLIRLGSPVEAREFEARPTSAPSVGAPPPPPRAAREMPMGSAPSAPRPPALGSPLSGVWSRVAAGLRGIAGAIGGIGAGTPGRRPPADSKPTDLVSDRGFASDGATRMTDQPVLFGVSAPRTVVPGATFTARFAAYVEAREYAVARRLRDLSGNQAQPVLGLRPERGGCWKRGAPVTVQVSGPSLVAEPGHLTFEWDGVENIIAFAVRVAPEAKGSLALRFEVFLGGVSVTSIVMDLSAEAMAADAPATVSGRAPATAFASYSSKDAALVSQCLSALWRWDPGLEIYQDCLDLNPNEEWKVELERVIPEKDAFLLFWSVNAMRSQWVQWELELREKARGVESVRLMPLDDPSLAPPPRQFEARQLRDRFMIARQAALWLQDQRPAP
jgi:hypothetical protein